MWRVLCSECGKLVEQITGGPRRRFCSDSCKSRHGARSRAAALPERACLQCGTVYQPKWVSQVKFCGESCKNKYAHAHSWKKKELICQDCGVVFEGLRKDNKRCDSCRRAFANQQTMVRRAALNPLVQIGIGSGGNQHYNPALGGRKGCSDKHYRKTALLTQGCVCNLCEETLPAELLVVHHINLDRTDQSPDNLVVLCPTHHVLVHNDIKRRARQEKKITPELCISVWQSQKESRRKIAELSKEVPAQQGSLEPKADGDISQGQSVPAEGQGKPSV